MPTTHAPACDDPALGERRRGSRPSIKRRADFCFKWIDGIEGLDKLETRDHRRAFLLNLVCFAAGIPVRREEPDLFDADLEARTVAMLRGAVECIRSRRLNPTKKVQIPVPLALERLDVVR